MPTIKFYTYSLASKGMKELKRELVERGHRVLALRKQGSRYRYKQGHYLINWGFGREVPSLLSSCPSSHFLNGDPSIVIKASNKLSCFRKIQEAGNLAILPRFTNDKEEAKEFFDETDKVYCRTELDSSQGRGIVIANDRDSLVDAPLYTAGISCQREFRVHILGSQVIDFAMKKRMRSERREEEGITLNEDVRNHDNGYIFARVDVTLPNQVRDAGLAAVSSLGLDLGAVDVVLDEYENAKVLEINTAPGLTGTTTTRYADAVETWMS